MANKRSQRETARDRKARVAEMRQQQRAAERRKTFLVIGLAVVLGLGLVAAAAVPLVLRARNKPANQPLSAFGVPAAQASCGPATTDPATGGNDHQPAGTKIAFAQIPPSSGPHYPSPALGKTFYTAADRPPAAQLVHNLEHGYTVLWYDDTITGATLTQVQSLASKLAAQTGGKFIATAWNNADGAFPAGTHVAVSHWGKTAGHRLLCGQLSGEAVGAFVTQFPTSDSPEPNGA
ncbi:MAG: DUF3105 domain-containing protein [Actinomycetota bacterium]